MVGRAEPRPFTEPRLGGSRPGLLGPEFYNRPTLEVAEDLIGMVLVRPIGGESVSGVIVETEAYIGEDDRACHAWRGRTARTEAMFGPPGYAYVYLIYGVHHCLNAVTEAPGFPAAVLIRAIEPLDGLARLGRNRPGAPRASDIGSGPGKLCQAMGIDRRLNAVSLCGSELWIEDRAIDPGPVAASPRVGVDYAADYRDKPWRFFVEGNPHVSRARFDRGAARRSQ